MPVDRLPGASNLIDVLDRVLDKGIVVDGWARVSLDGIDVISGKARVVVASDDTQLRGHSSTPTGTGNSKEDPVRRSSGRRARGRL